jgi:hypothetical protein
MVSSVFAVVVRFETSNAARKGEENTPKERKVVKTLETIFQ